MKWSALLVSLTMLALLLATRPLDGQEQQSQFEHLKGLRPFIGTWAGDLDIPGLPEDSRVLLTCRWTANRSYATMQFTRVTGEERTPMGMVLIGLNAETKEPHSWAFWPDQQAQGKVELAAKAFTVHSKGKTLEGVATSAEVSYTVADNMLTIEVTKAMRGETESPDITIELERQRRRRQAASE